MKIIRTMSLNYLVLIIGITALSLKQVCATDSVSNEVEMTLNGTMRAIIWDRLPLRNDEDLKVGGPMEKYYGYSGGLSEDILKSYATLIYTVAGADGISEDESVYIKGQLKLLCSDKQGSGISQPVIEEHVAGLNSKANAGELKEGDVKAAIDAHVRNLMAVGEPSNIITAAAKCALRDAIMAARADGEFSAQERSATISAANELGISKEELKLLEKGCKKATLLNIYPVIIDAPNFVKEVNAFYEEVKKYYTDK